MGPRFSFLGNWIPSATKSETPHRLLLTVPQPDLTFMGPTSWRQLSTRHNEGTGSEYRPSSGHSVPGGSCPSCQQLPRCPVSPQPRSPARSFSVSYK